jgi:hypothetical protein
MRVYGAVLALVIVGVGAASCERAPVSGIGLSMSAPQGALDDATALELLVFPAADATCVDGVASPIPGDARSFTLSKADCAGGATWCGEITLERDESEQMFYVEASSSAGVLARGCATAVIDKDPIDVAIQVVRVVEESCCGDGELQPGELCDNGGSESCDGSTESFDCAPDCTTKLLTIDDGNGSGGLTMTFAGGDGELAGGLRAAWNHEAGVIDIGQRILQADLSPIATPAVLAEPFRVYLRCSGAVQAASRDQTTPSIAPLANGAALAFLSNEKSLGRVDAVVLFTNSDGCSDMQSALAASDELTSAADVAIAAGPAGQALVVWEQGGSLRARTFDGETLGAPFSITADGSGVSVSGGPDGWAIAFAGAGAGDADGVFLVRVSPAGDAAEPVLVNAKTSGVQDQPAVSMQTDGSVAVAFRSGDDVFLQRYRASGEAVVDDQAAALHGDAAGAQRAPAISAGPSGNYFVVAWESDSTIRARYASKDGSFLFNPVSGQNDDFLVTRDATSPSGPAVAIAESVVFGWTDPEAGGVVVRRFPLPE